MAYVQRKRTRGFKLSPGTICCTRPGRYQNPYRIGEYFTAEQAVYFYRQEAEQWPAEYRAKIVKELSGHDLACWCKIGEPCHVQDVLIPMIESAIR